MDSGNVSVNTNDSDLKTHQTASQSENSDHVSSNQSSSDEAIRLGGSTETLTPNDDMETPVNNDNIEKDKDSDDSPLPTSDRIPSHIFATTNTTAPAEWSVCSNESLFSIHTGNMSFTKEQLSWMTKSGELYYNGDPTFSGPLIDLPGCYTPTGNISREITKKSDNLNDSQFGVNNEAAAAETMREVLRETESENKDNIAAKEASYHSRTCSLHSDASGKSFAFPILTGDADKSGLIQKSGRNKKQQLNPTISTKDTPPQIPPETPKSETPKSETSKANSRQASGFKRWFSCFTCCASCS